MLVAIIPWGFTLLAAALWVLYTSLNTKRKIRRIQRAIQKGFYLDTYVANDFDVVEMKLLGLTTLADLCARTMTVQYLHDDQDRPDLVTGFRVKVTL